MGIGGIGFDYLKQIEQTKTLGANATTAGTATTGTEEASLMTGNGAIQTDATTAEDELAALMEEMGTEGTEETEGAEDAAGTNAAEGAQGTTGTEGAAIVPQTEEGKKLQEEIEKLEEEKEKNLEKMEKIEAHIEDLTAQAEENIMKAASQQEAAVKDHEEETQQAVDEQLNAYIAANKEGGEGMTREELQGNIQGALGHIPAVADAVSGLLAANEQINEIDACLGELNDLITDTQSIEQEIEGKQQSMEAVEQAAQQAAQAQNGCCDPIGFQATDKNGQQAQYDFIVDDGNFDSTSDFLGAENQWAAMQALDTSGDGIVDTQELAAGNIKAVKTNADGSQEVVDMAEEFGEDFSIDLNSYQQGGSHSAIDTTTDKDGDGIADQQLLGTFNVNANGQTIQGYNTLDDVDFLSENYGVTAGEQATVDENEMQYSEDLQPHVDFFNTYTQKVEELKEALMQGWEGLSLSSESMNNYNDVAKTEANDNAANFFKSLELTEDENAETSGIEEIESTDESGLETELTDAEQEELLEENLGLFAA